MVVASNTSPISNLAMVGRLDLLRFQFGQVLIPGAVRRELDQLPFVQARAALEQAIHTGWLQESLCKNEALASILSLSLDAGEAEAIALASDLDADILLMDERQGRAAARHIGIRVIGVLGVLLRAKKDGWIDAVRDEIRRLREEAGFYVAPVLEAEVLRAAGE